MTLSQIDAAYREQLKFERQQWARQIRAVNWGMGADSRQLCELFEILEE